MEIRQYGEQTWIRTTHHSDNASFRTLASYIFGGNKDQQKLAMTAPVITGQHMAFILPAGTSQHNAPIPNSQPIQFVSVPARQLATLHFSWLTSPKRVERKTAELLAKLQAHSIEPRGKAFLMRYNDPWTPPFLRRNEVAIEVRPATGS